MTRDEIERRKALCRASLGARNWLEGFAREDEFNSAHDPTTMLALYEELEALREVERAARDRLEIWTHDTYCALLAALDRLAAVREGKP